MARNYYSFSGSIKRRAREHGVDSMFAWTIFIFLLIGFTLFCWMGSFYVFGHPEKAANYHLLKRLHKLEEPERFQITAAPRGEFLKPSQLLERYSHLSPIETKRLNERLLRNFLRNYHQSRELVPYAVGTYKVMDVFPLNQKNFFHSGVVALLQAVEQPEVLLEQVFTADSENTMALQQALVTGKELKLEKPLDLSAIIFIDHLKNGRLKFTTMPILYGSYGTKQGDISFRLEPPVNLAVEEGLPILKTEEMNQADEAFMPFRKAIAAKMEKTNIKNGELTDANNTQLARITKEDSSIPTKKEPPSKKATAVSSTPVLTAPRAIPLSGEPPVARAVAVNAPAVLPAIAVKPSSSPSSNPFSTTANTSTSPTILAPSSTVPTAVLPTPTPTVNMTGGVWPVYEAGKMPRGRMVDSSEIATLAEQGVAGERLYLEGNFSVTASGQDRAVLRYQAATSGLPIGRTGNIRIIASYPAGMIPPAEGTSLVQDRQHPLMITDVKKEKDGSINLYVREITK